jgi:hypothetical protein
MRDEKQKKPARAGLSQKFINLKSALQKDYDCDHQTETGDN